MAAASKTKTSDIKKLLDAYNKKREQLGIDPPGAVLFYYTRSNHSDDMNIFVTSNGDGTFLARKFTGPMLEVIGSQEQDEVDRRDNLTSAQALQLAGEWQEELEEE